MTEVRRQRLLGGHGAGAQETGQSGGCSCLEFLINPEATSGEELRLWADYYDATARVLEIMRTQGTTTTAVAQIVAEEAKAAGALKRIKEIRAIKD